jgi:hypothetical protein
LGLRFRPTSCRPLLSNPYGPPGNRNAKKHGLYASDARRREDKAVFQTLRAIEDDLAELSAQRRLILDGIGRKLRDLSKVEAYVGGLSSIVNKRTRALIPAVVEKHPLLEWIRRDLEMLGLERRSREIKLADYLEAKNGPGSWRSSSPSATGISSALCPRSATSGRGAPGARS